MKLKKKTVKRLRRLLLVSVALVVMVSFVAIVTRLTLTPTAAQPTFNLLTVTPNKLIRIYGQGFSFNEPNGYQVVTTFHVGNVKNYSVTATDGYIIGTDVDISMIPPGVYDCWITDPTFGNSNHVTLTIATPVPEFSSLAVVAFSALAASLYLLRRRRA